MAIGRISGQLLKDNLLRDGVNLKFENDLLYLNVSDTDDPDNHRIGIKTTNPRLGTVFDVNGKAFLNEIETDFFTSDLVTITSNRIKTTLGDLELQAGTSNDRILIKNNVRVEGDLHATGSITADGSLLLGDSDTDDIVFVADINSNIIPNTNKTYDIGTDGSQSTGKAWRRVYVDNMRLGDPIKINNQYFTLAQTSIPGSGTKPTKSFNAIDVNSNYVELTNLNTNGHLALSSNGNGLIECLKTTRVHEDLNVLGDIATDNANYILIGEPEYGILDGAVEMTENTSLTDGVAQLNLTLTLLVPLAPPDFPNNQNLVITGGYQGAGDFQQRILRQPTANQSLNGNSITPVSVGTVVYVIRDASFITNTITATGPGNRGDLILKFNSTPVITKRLTSGNSTQVITSVLKSTTQGSDLVGYIQPKLGVMVPGHIIVITNQGNNFGGLGSPGTCYYVDAVTSKNLKLKLYDKSTGTIGAAFQATSTISNGTLNFATADDTGTFYNNDQTIAMTVTNNLAFPLETPGFHEIFSVQVYATPPALPGWNTIQLEHTEAGQTIIGNTQSNIGIWYYDNTVTAQPVFTNELFNLKTSSIIYSSGVPHYTSSTKYQLSFDLDWNPGLTNHDSVGYEILTTEAIGPWTSSNNKNYTNLAYTYLPETMTVTNGVGPNNTDFTVNIIPGFGAWTTTTTVPKIIANNSYDTAESVFPPLNNKILYKTGTTGTISFLEETNIKFTTSLSNSDAGATRCVNPDAGVVIDTPVFVAGSSLINSQTGPFYSTDAIVAGYSPGVNALSHNRIDYSVGYLPAGPNLSTRSATDPQYFTFRFSREGVSKFSLTYTTPTGVEAIFCAMPGTGGISGTTSTLNKWLDLRINSTLADGCALGGNMNSAAIGTITLNCSFGTLSSTNATNNEIWVRIKLNPNQRITRLTLGAATV